MQQKYKVLKNIIFMKPKSHVFCLPGQLRHGPQVYLAARLRPAPPLVPLEGLRICGYGGADVWTAGIPERYIVNYQAGMGINEKHNEMYRFFRAVKPDIIVTHQPAYGINDKTSYGGPFGSPSLRTYCDNNPVMLCLTGHAHDAWGVKPLDDTLFLNPSNFGEVTQTTGEVTEGGFFYQIDIDGREVQKIIFKKICEDRSTMWPITTRKNDVWIEEIIDQERYKALKKGELRYHR